MAQKGLCHLAREKMLQDRGALSKEEGDVDRECKAMHEGNFRSNWMREVGEDKKEREMEADRETEEEVSREEEKEENETVIVKRRCVNHVSAEAFEF